MKVFVKKSGYLKIKNREFWIYQNEIERWEESKSKVAKLYYKKEFLATAFFNPLSKISARILDFADIEVDRDFFEKRIQKAIEKREKLKDITNSYRLIHSEADFLPGLIVDKYEDFLIVNFNTAAMDSFKEIIIEILKEKISLKGIYEKSDKIRQKEGLKIEEKTLFGEVLNRFIIKENGKKFLTHLIEGQKTGFFLDQRKNRSIIAKYANKKTLDLFANAGGFGIYANAPFTKFVEISPLASSFIEENCKLNNLKNYEIKNEDVFKFLEKEKEKYDLIIIDPPAFAKNLSAKKGALKGWKYLIVNSLKILEEGGYLALFSCSAAIRSKDLLDLALSSSKIENCYLEVVEFLKQDIDHPYILNMPKSLYLMGVLLRRV